MKTEGFDPDVEWSPFVRDGMVGYKVTRVYDGEVTFIYFNPSTSGKGEPDVFVYQGPSGDPANDGSVCHLTPVFDET